MTAAISFLASSDASYMTGSAVVADGGLTAQLQDSVGWRMYEWVTCRGCGERLIDRVVGQSFDNFE